MVKHRYYCLIFLASVLIYNVKAKGQDKPVIWKFVDLNRIGAYMPLINGQPLVVKDAGRSAISFNGIDGSLTIPDIPIAGWPKFTIQVLFKPDGNGPVEPRFMHFEDKDGIRGTLEIRLTKKKTWYLDAFLKNAAAKGLTLIDSVQQHPTDRWYWAAMVYDGKTMHSYVNGIKQLEGDITFPPVSNGKIAFGARLNKVGWFKGLVSEARFYPDALSVELLEKVKE